jgi:hypothetical protein
VENLGSNRCNPGPRLNAATSHVFRLLDHRRHCERTIRDFFAAIAEHACYDSRDGKEYFEAQQAIDRAMTEALWRSNEVDVHNNMLDRIEGINAPDYGEIDLRLDGVARWYLERREALRKQDTAPKDRPLSRHDADGSH